MPLKSNIRDSLTVCFVSTVSLLAFSACTAEKSKEKTAETSTETKPVEQKQPEPDKKVTNEPDLPQLKPVAPIMRQALLPDNIVICTVASKPILVRDFKREYANEQTQFQLAVLFNPQLSQPMLKKAAEQKVVLTEDEKKKVLQAARAPQNLGGKTVSQFLKERKMTEEQFDRAALDMGLAFKTGSRNIEAGIMDALVNQTLLVNAAKSNGMEKAAFNRYIEKKHTKEFQDTLKLSGLNAEDFKQEFLKAQLVELMKMKIERDTPVGDDVLNKVYMQNRETFFKHEGRVKWSQIVIAAPSVDAPPLESVRTQVKRTNPDATGAELEKLIQEAETYQREKAEKIISDIKGGADFAQQANEFTDDIPQRASKKGGDMGWMAVKDVGMIDMHLAHELGELKPGQMANEPIKTTFGYHIIKVNAREPAGYVPFSEAKEKLKLVINAKDPEWSVKKWLLEQRAKTPILLSEEFETIVAKMKPQS